MKPLFSFFLIILFQAFAYSQVKVLDDLNSLNGWKKYTAEGVDLSFSSVKGVEGNAVKVEYNFVKGGGYGGIQKKIPVDLPDNFQFTFYLKAENPNNNFEFKLLDSSGENVWWVNNRNFEFPKEWTKVTIKKRHISFAWGPIEDKSLKKIDRIEFTIASYSGGKGSVYIDELKFEPLPPVSKKIEKPVISTSSFLKNFGAENLSDNDPRSFWKSSSEENQSIIIDFKQPREFGGLTIDWDSLDYAETYNVSISTNMKDWELAYSVSKNKGNRSYIRLKEAEALYLKLDLLKSSRGEGYSIKEMNILDIDYSSDPNKFFVNIAKDLPRGYLPRYFSEVASYWTLIGVNGDEKESLINEEGMIETDKLSFSIEPFLYTDKLITWNEAKITQSLEDNYLPIPSVQWNAGDLILQIKAFAEGEANKNSVLYAFYTLSNNSSEIKKGNLYLAIRPFQVNPYYQFLNITGGISKISSINYKPGRILINDEKVIIPVTGNDEFGAAVFDEGGILSYIRNNKTPESLSAEDNTGFASGALKYMFELKPGEQKVICLAVPYYPQNNSSALSNNYEPGDITKKLQDVKEFWKGKIGHVKFYLPSSADNIINTYFSNLAFILINRDRAGIQPGSRSYERSWIRDGSLTSSALLKSGIIDEVKEFINWYAGYQFEDGKIPCVVDKRGADPVPENDSHGEFIFLVKQYFNFTKDTSFLRSNYSHVLKAADYIGKLTSQRLTDFYKNGNDSIRSLYGLLPESISHEGYSAKPMHSYWDDFFAMRGLKDAVDIASILYKPEDVKKLKNLRDTFRTNLYNSLRLAIDYKDIDYIPGCAELGDFDATSTTIAIYPCNELKNLPQPEAANTFNIYYEFFENRKNPGTEWTAYTPYEIRTIGSFIFLDEIEKAHLILKYFLNDRKPHEWNQWAEVVWKDRRYPGFIGDMPHTWVGSDYINAVRAMFVYENDYDTSLVLGAGLAKDWIDSPQGMRVENLNTYHGQLSYSVKKEADKYFFDLYGNISMPPGDIIIKNFNKGTLPGNVSVNGKKAAGFTDDKIVIKEFPAKVIIEY